MKRIRAQISAIPSPPDGAPPAKSIWLVATVVIMEEAPDVNGVALTKQRTWGWFPSIEKALDASRCMQEWFWPTVLARQERFVVFEEFGPGLVPSNRTERWYRVTQSSEERVLLAPCVKPPAISRIVNFAMG